jgi:hypothetical protein
MFDLITKICLFISHYTLDTLIDLMHASIVYWFTCNSRINWFNARISWFNVRIYTFDACIKSVNNIIQLKRASIPLKNKECNNSELKLSITRNTVSKAH